jgi:hypothetical protein
MLVDIEEGYEMKGRAATTALSSSSTNTIKEEV